MAASRYPAAQPRRDAWVEVDLSAIEHNVRTLLRMLGDSRDLMAVVKADAYGHGVTMLIPALEALGVSMLGVASLDEAMAARRTGTKLPILILGPTPDWALRTAIQHGFRLTVFDPHHLSGIRQCIQQLGLTERHELPLRVHVKVDTGMHRIGVPWQEAPAFYGACRSLAGVLDGGLEIEGIFTHLACGEADTPSRQQEQRFAEVLAQLGELPRWVHVENSARLMSNQALELLPQLNLARAGLALYGYPAPPFKPAMGLKARLTHIHTAQPGEGISYGHTHHIGEQARRLATVPLGYADGVARGLSNNIQAKLHEVLVPQVGIITMDQMMFDITEVPDAVHIGDTLTLLDGDLLTLSRWAEVTGTIEYEPMCALRVRLPRVYIRSAL